MSRFTTFTDFRNRQADDTVEILDQVGVSVSVYRPDIPDEGNIGFDTEMGALTFVKNILAYLVQVKGVPAKEVRTDQATGTNVEYTGITQEKDVRIGDVWRLKKADYVVSQVNPTMDGRTEARLERKV